MFDHHRHARRGDRQYAAGEIAWATLQTRGFGNYIEVLAGLGELGDVAGLTLRGLVVLAEGVG